MPGNLRANFEPGSPELRGVRPASVIGARQAEGSPKRVGRHCPSQMKGGQNLQTKLRETPSRWVQLGWSMAFGNRKWQLYGEMAQSFK